MVCVYSGVYKFERISSIKGWCQQRWYHPIKTPKAISDEIAIDGIEDDRYEIVADDWGRKERSEFADDIQALNPELFQS
ncbi:hypothetical protein WG8_4383 [Paenibacillus sp. Aloe-11]|nr:hypothetical protein WG8_4383 [Paenibacillus sp. Aloe-11]